VADQHGLPGALMVPRRGVLAVGLCCGLPNGMTVNANQMAAAN
jgi:hypothetical protein